jgi:hypothetical protein
MRMVSLREKRRGSASASLPYLGTIWLAFLAAHLQQALAKHQPIADVLSPPIQNQQNQQQHGLLHPSGTFSVSNRDLVRGGSSTWLADPEIPNTMVNDDPYRPPETNLEHMSLALRLTGEFNRRLNAGTRQFKEQEPLQQHYQSPRITDPLRGGESSLMNVQQTVGIRPPPPPPPPPFLPKIRGTVETTGETTAATTVPLTLFHAKAPRASKKGAPVRRGSARWGPDLLTYLRHLADLMGLSQEESSLEFAMAMIYMDRACSVETPRSNGMPPCPFCAPRTVHRLCLTALLVATQAVRGTSLEEYYPGRLDSLGIPLPQLQHMVEWMTGSLGDLGFFLTPNQMADWRRMWEYRFPSSSSLSLSSTRKQAPHGIPQSGAGYPSDSSMDPQEHNHHASVDTHRHAVVVE